MNPEISRKDSCAEVALLWEQGTTRSGFESE